MLEKMDNQAIFHKSAPDLKQCQVGHMLWKESL